LLLAAFAILVRCRYGWDIGFFVKLRPFLLAASVLLIAFGFYQKWRAKQCQCKPNLLSKVLLWFSAIVVLVFILFPQAIANILANLLAG